MEYNFSEIEKKWQDYWEQNKTFKTEYNPLKPKYYILDMFPYPSGAGLHVGHPEGYTATDIVSRYKRMKGFNVLHPMGWDAFGLPAEQYAIQTGTHPAVTTNKNCDTFRRQIKMLGLSYDWDREINTTDQKYFKWTQWIFIRLYNTWFDEKIQKGRPISELPVPEEIKIAGIEAIRNYVNKKRLAYYDNAQVWYCDNCKIVCANEEVLMDGTHEKCGNPVNKKNLKQWMLRIPLYAERLISGLDSLDWPEGVKDMQRNWIGRSTGAEVDFKIDGIDEKLRVFTTRPDTLFGATYMVIAPEHPLAEIITTDECKQAVSDYIRAAAIKSELDRTDLAKEKTGVFTGRYAINPVNGKKIPIWVADYVLTGYGTGAIMAVPAHDTRDFEFAKKFNISVDCILDPVSAEPGLREKVLKGDACWTEDGEYINSSSAVTGLDINGMNKDKGIQTVIDWLVKTGRGEGKINYKMRDWLFSRQRYWGEPFPVIHWEDGEISVLDDSELPLNLPSLEKYAPGDDGESPLANAADWLYISDKNGRKGRRETNTMPQWAGSCWYYLRYIDPHNDKEPFSKQLENYWMPVDLYIGGAEHAVLHLLYSRFWHKVLFDLGIVSTDEPYQKLFNQGMILAFAYETKTGMKVIQDFVVEKDGKFYMTDPEKEVRVSKNNYLIKPDEIVYENKIGLKITNDFVIEKDGKFYEISAEDEVKQIVAKMSKSLKNVVNPDDVVKQYGADSLRLYEMFMGPLEATKPWTDTGVKGVFGFLGRVFRFFCNTESYFEGQEDAEVMKMLHKTIQKVGFDVENLSFNTAIAQMMIFNNLCIKKQKVTKQTGETFAKVLAPFAPHLAEEIWQLLGNKVTLAYESFPMFDEKYLVESNFNYPVSFNGKKRFEIELPVDMPVSDIEKIVLAEPAAQKWLEGKAPKKVIIVPNKIVNIVV